MTASSHDRFVLDVVTNDLPGFVTVSVFADAANSSAFQIPLPGGITSSTIFEAPYSSFAPSLGTGGDFTNVGAIEFFISAGIQRDMVLQIDSIVTAVPEPATLCLAVSAALVMAGCRRFEGSNSAPVREPCR